MEEVMKSSGVTLPQPESAIIIPFAPSLPPPPPPRRVGLLDMPNLIVSSVLSHLNLSDWLTLRLTCPRTKSWVESRYMDKIRLHIRTKKDFLTLVSHTTTPFTNFSFSYKLSSLIMSPSCSFSYISAWTSLFAPTSLHFTNQVDGNAMIRLISSCGESLRILIIEEVDGTMLAELSMKETLSLALACAQLEHLGVHEILSDDMRGADFYVRSLLLACCTSLKSVTVPYLTFSPISSYPLKYANAGLDRNSTTTPTDVLIVRPMIDIFESKLMTPYLESVIVVPESRSLLSDSALFCLTLLCYHRRINLVYDKYSEVTSLNLGKLSYSLRSESSMQMSEIASKIMTCMASTTDILLNYEFANLRKLVVQFSTLHIERDIFVVQSFPRLTTLSIDFKMRKQLHALRCSKVKRMDMFVQGMLEVARPTVKDLRILNHSVVEAVIGLRVERIVHCFYNVTRLVILGYGGREKEWVALWTGLRLLERVEVENCEGLGDKGLLGEDWTRPVFSRLTDLREVKLTKVGRITDLSYIIAICNMRLVRFHHEPLYPSDVTFEGYNSLSTGDFAKTIKILTGTISNFGRRTKNELVEYLSCFESLHDEERKKMVKEFKFRRKSRFGFVTFAAFK